MPQSYGNFKLCRSFLTAVEGVNDYVVDQMHKKKPNEQCAVVLDIDSTVLCHLGENTAKPHAFEPMREFYKLLLRSGVTVFFVTARPEGESNRRWTERELKRLGFDGYKALYMLDGKNYDVESADFSEFKYQMRKDIAQTYKLLVTIGDSVHDLGRPSDPMIRALATQPITDDYYYVFTNPQDPAQLALKLPTDKD